ncbi:MAG TPA: MFS transporter, partial [Gemmatimonadales bacterium]|nr:MFS transporter [Gemmatimonadales bacterium]
MKQAGRIDRVLRLFSDVKSGEGITALLLTFDVFLLLSSYYVIKPVREALILAVENGDRIKSYASAGQTILLLLLVPLYGMLADALPRRRLLNAVTAFFVACLVLFWAMARAQLPVGIPFFLWVGIFNVMIVAQFWSFANDLYSKDQGERLFPIIGFGAALGAVVGSGITGLLIGFLGIPELLLVAAALLVLAAFISTVADRREHRRAEGHLPPNLSSAGIPAASGEYQRVMTDAGVQTTISTVGPLPSGKNAFALVFGNRYLLLIALLMLMLNWVSSVGEFILSNTVKTLAEQAVANGTAGGLSAGEYIGRFYSEFFFGVNLASLLLQLFVVSRIIKYVGVTVAILILPLIAFSGFAALGFLPVLSLVRWIKTAENGVSYSLQNTVRNILFLPTSREEKYKAKQAIDSFFVRFGDVL